MMRSEPTLEIGEGEVGEGGGTERDVASFLVFYIPEWCNSKIKRITIFITTVFNTIYYSNSILYTSMIPGSNTTA